MSIILSTEQNGRHFCCYCSKDFGRKGSATHHFRKKHPELLPTSTRSTRNLTSTLFNTSGLYECTDCNPGASEIEMKEFNWESCQAKEDKVHDVYNTFHLSPYGDCADFVKTWKMDDNATLTWQWEEGDKSRSRPQSNNHPILFLN